jgi:uncharacterized membrane protein
MNCTVLIMTIFTYMIDHVEPKMEVQAEQVQWVFGCPQVSSCEEANIGGSRQAPLHLTNALIFYFEALLYILLGCTLSL